MIGNISQFWRLTRELDVNAIRAEIERVPAVRVLGSDQASADRVARMVDPDATDADIVTGTLAGWRQQPRSLPASPDLVVVALGSPLDQASRRVLAELGVGDTPVLLVQAQEEPHLVLVGIPEERVVALHPGDDEAQARDQVLAALVRLAPETMLPLGRRHPRVREAVADHLIRDTSRVNAQFAALSSLPANLPLVGGLVGDMADILVLTKNQVILLFKLAGLYGRNLALGPRTLAEVLPVVGGAFIWRSTARALVGLLPGAVSVVPKALIAYSGTFVVGELARYYYHYGRKAPPEAVKELTAQSLRLARRTLGTLGRRRDGG